VKVKYKFRDKNILAISDLHAPYHHPDALRFLAALKRKYKFDLVVDGGDMLDFHNISFHKSDPDLLNAGDELSQARLFTKQLEKLFHEMYVIGSNHGDLPLRKFFDAGLPKDMLRSYNEIYKVGKGWRFVDDLTLVDSEEIIYFAHGISKNGLKLATQRGVNVVQFHFHTEFRIDYASNPRNLLWSINSGCLIDKKSLAFAYDALNLNRPIIGCSGVIQGSPRLFPMLLDKLGNWTGVVP
jgi:predicted MPP superfamily phosphohydrolase